MKVDSDDLIDAAGVAGVLGLANRTSVSVYQRRYPAMPRPVVDLGPGRTKLWSKSAVQSWSLAADLRSPQTIATAELAQLALHGERLAQGLFRSTYTAARQHALGGGKQEREVDRSRRTAYQLAVDQARLTDPTFHVTAPDNWLEEQ